MGRGGVRPGTLLDLQQGTREKMEGGAFPAVTNWFPAMAPIPGA